MAIPPLSRELAQEAVDALERNGGNKTHAAAELGMERSTFRARIRAAERYGLLKVSKPMAQAPEGFNIKGTSTLYNSDGEVTAQWVKTTADAEAQQAAMEAALEAARETLPRLKPIKAPKHTLEHLCNVYTITDAHVGMLAWRKEGGADWDLKIAEETLTGCFEAMVKQSPKAHTCVVAQLGDFLHWDGLEAVTPSSGHILDADGRFEKVTRIAVRVLRRLVDFALQHHEHVHVLMAEGNHDIASSVWLRVIFSTLYENEPRVTIDTSPLPYYAFQWGETALFWHHGHKKKLPQLPLMFAAQFSEIWGNTQKRYGHTGHMHHEKVEEHSGIKMRQHATLAARDAYAARGGWISDREAKSFTYHQKRGEVASVTITPEMLEDVA